MRKFWSNFLLFGLNKYTIAASDSQYNFYLTEIISLYIFIISDESSPTLEYVNLLLNPEGYTGYAGDDAHKIWNSIYNENCFNDK